MSRAFLVFCILTLILLAGVGEAFHARLLSIGHFVWADYTQLRQPLIKPDCDSNQNIDQAILDLREQHVASQNTDNSVDDALFDLFEPEPFNETAARRSLQSALELCQSQFKTYDDVVLQKTVWVTVFAAIEQGLATFVVSVFAHQKILLMLLIAVSVALASVKGQHISFKQPRNVFEYRLAQWAQLLANGLILGSTLAYRWEVVSTGSKLQQPILMGVVIIALVFLCVVNVALIFWSSKRFQLQSAENTRNQLAVIPLYAIMAFVASVYFVIHEQHFAGLAIFFSQLLEEAGIFLKVCLYLWIGMLVKNTDIGRRIFNLIRSFRLPPALLVLLVMLLMAYPTAFTGASGIVILALGGLLYSELTRSGVRPSLAQAATAMSGSMGVVLSPCLLVVLIAALNKEVVTTQLYFWGTWIFLGSFVILGLILALLSFFKIVPSGVSLPSESQLKTPLFSSALEACLPYGLILLLGGGGFYWGLGMKLDELTAAYVLPWLFGAIIVFEARQTAKSDLKKKSIWRLGYQKVLHAIDEGSIHMGALIMLMALTFAIGGVLDRSQLLGVIGLDWTNPAVMMLVCVVILVILGMIMEPFGAIVLVTTALAPIAYQNGIDPVHFWMVALVAFELGYLSPPVALNHLLTRQVISGVSSKAPQRVVEVGVVERGQQLSAIQEGWLRIETIALPIIVLAVTLLLVAFVPLWMR